MDYLQLVKDNIKIYNLKFKDLNESKTSTGSADSNLFCKIIIGDKSDYIQGIFKKCGQKTALKYFEDKDLFTKQLQKENCYDKYLLNKKIIDFSEIPEDLKEKFYNNNNLEL